MKIISWNVNGIRAIERKGFLQWLKKEKPDIIGVQEIKAQENQLSKELLSPDNYHGYFNPAERKGYSGVAIFSKEKPLKIINGFNISEFDIEGRVIAADFGEFIYFNIYFPNGKRSLERLEYKLEFYDAALEYFDRLVKEGKKLIIGGDYNTAHHEIDLARPKANETISGFLPVERKWLDKLEKHGYVKYQIHRYTFVTGVSLLMLARAYIPMKQIVLALLQGVT